MRQAEAAGEAVLAHAVEVLQRSAVPAAVRRARGPVGQRVVEAATEVGADLIVIGSRGHGRLEELLLGSVSDAVARHARCSVLIVR
jgi:nucleotide-binding universal stress UspA family protein